jgi:phosphonate transport system substrate-binding protein
MPRLRLTYYPDITQHRTDAEVRDAIVTFSAALAKDLSRRAGQEFTIDVLPVVTVPLQTAMIADGRCEIALIKPSSYIYAHRRNTSVLPAAVALRTIDGKAGDVYFAQIYTHADTGIHTMDDLRERCRGPHRPSIGFGDPFSTANFLVPCAMLLKQQLHPLTRFSRVEFFGGHELVARAVYERRADIGAGHDGVIVDLARQPGFEDAASKLLRLDRMIIHSDPVAVCVGDPSLRANLEASLLAIAEEESVKQALDIFWGGVVGLGRTKHENYASIEQAIDSLAIREEDILGE